MCGLLLSLVTNFMQSSIINFSLQSFQLQLNPVLSLIMLITTYSVLWLEIWLVLDRKPTLCQISYTVIQRDKKLPFSSSSAFQYLYMMIPTNENG